MAAGSKTLPHGQKIEHQLHKHRRIAADVTTVHEKLPFDLSGEVALHVVQLPVVPCHGQVGEHKRRDGEQPRIAVRTVAPTRRQPDELRPQAARDGVVRFDVRSIEQKIGMRDPRNEPPAHHPRLPCGTSAGPLADRPLHGEPPRHVARVVITRGLQVAQPAESMQRTMPRQIGRTDLKRRAIPQRRGHAGKPHVTIAQFLPETGIGRAQILRHDQQMSETG